MSLVELGLLAQPGIAPAESLAWDRWCLAAAADGAAGFLRVWDAPGEVLALGRYHLAPTTEGDALFRRHTGGRVLPCGAGFVGVTLVLPHRSALESPDPLALAPEQVMNRCVRGLLAGLATLGVSAVYPGLDTITVARRILAGLAFEVAPDGALLFEATLACTRDLSILPRLLDRHDPGGIVSVSMLAADDVTSLAREADSDDVTVDELAARLAGGYAARIGLRFSPVTPPVPPRVSPAEGLGARVPSPRRTQHGRSAIRLGTLEVHFALDAGRLDDVLLAGDFIADSSGIAALERALAGCPAQRDAIARVVREVVRPPAHFILGVGPLETVVDTIVRGLPG